jgi:hypothetical protein
VATVRSTQHGRNTPVHFPFADDSRKRRLVVSFWSIGFGLVSGVAGWMISEFLAKPFRRGIDLVADARTSILVYANVEARAKVSPNGYAAHVELTEESEKRLRKAEEVLRELGAKMQAFAGTDRAAAFVLRALGTDLRSAGIALIGLSNSIGRYGQQRHNAQQRVAAVLGVPQN